MSTEPESSVNVVSDQSTPLLLLESSQYHNPQLWLDNEENQKKVLEIVSPLVLTTDNVSRLQSLFCDEMELGLSSANSNSSMLMINTFVPSMSSIQRDRLAGNYISLDIGSSNFRVLYAKLGSDTSSSDQDQFEVRYYDIPNDYRFGPSSDNLFNFIAEKIEHFLTEIRVDPTSSSSDPNHFLPLGFTFSFPMEQVAINVALLKVWTKKFDLPDVVGKDVAGKLQQILNQNGNRFRIRVVAILNDSTGTLIKGQYLDPDCAVGVIFGTGHNVCYLEPVERIVKWTERSERYDGIKEVLVNMECGAFGDNGLIDFLQTKFDRLVDSHSLFPGSFTYEKYLGGHFLGEMVRFVLIDCVKSGALFGGLVSKQLSTPESITAKDVSDIESIDPKSSDQQQVIDLVTRLGYPNCCTDDCSIVRYVCSRVSVRIATMLASVLALLICRTERQRTVVAIDGSVYKKHPKMHRLTTDFIQEILNQKRVPKQFQLILAEDGSGKGAAIVAAISSKLRLGS